MVVVMSGSPNASAYPEPGSAKVFAARAQGEQSASKQRTAAFKELQEQKLAKSRKAAEARKQKKGCRGCQIQGAAGREQGKGG